MKIAFLQIFLAVLYLSAQAQKVSNIRAEQSGQDIVILYSLETTSPCDVSLLLSQDNGATWSLPLKNVSGDVGKNIIAGEKQITWRVLEEREQLIGDNIKFKAVTTPLLKLGNKTWMSKNLTVSRFCNGDEIKRVDNFRDWIASSESKTPAWCFVNFDSRTEEKYGKLYNGFAVIDPRGLAPVGYRIASVQDYKDAALYNGFLKEGNEMRNGFKNGASKFKPMFPYSGGILVGPSYDEIKKKWDGPLVSMFFGLESIVRIWTQSFESFESGDRVYWFGLNDDSDKIFFSMDRMGYGFPVRCLR